MVLPPLVCPPLPHTHTALPVRHPTEVPAAHDSVPHLLGQEGQQGQAVGGAARVGAGAGLSSRSDLVCQLSAAQVANDAKDAIMEAMAVKAQLPGDGHTSPPHPAATRG